MICPTCSRPNPDDAQFCIYCAAPLDVSEQSPDVNPATGSTVALDAPTQRPVAEAAALQPGASAGWQPVRYNKELTGAIWLIGLGLLFMTHTFWPGILVLAGLTAYVQEAARGRQTKAVRDLITLTGVAILFWTGLFWPGILILLGAVALLSPELRGRRTA